MHAYDRRISKKKALWLNIGLGAIAVFAAPTVYRAIGVFVTTDPFVGLYKRSVKPIDESIGIRMDGVELRDFDGAKLISSAYAGRVDVRRDRQAATLYRVTDGVYNGKGDPMHYGASTAVWNFQTKMVTVNGGVTLRNRDMDIKAQGLTFEDRTSKVRVQGDVTGKLFKGDIVASAFNYNMKSGEVDAGPVEWSGELALTPQDDQIAKPRRWDIKSSHMKSLGAKTDTYLYENATASDSDLILVAPIVQQNKKTDVLTASGGIEYYSGKADIKADSCVVYRKDKKVVLTGHVIMFVKPKAQEDDPPKIEKLPDFKPVNYDEVVPTNGSKPLTQDEEKVKEEELRSSKNLRDFPLVVVSTQTEYWYGKGNRHAVVTGSPQGRQTLKDNEWRHVWAHVALYDGEKEVMKLESTEKKFEALMKNSLGDHMRYDWMIISTKEDDDSIEGGQGDGSIYSSDDEIPKDEKKSTAPPKKTGGTGKTGGGTTGT